MIFLYYLTLLAVVLRTNPANGISKEFTNKPDSAITFAIEIYNYGHVPVNCEIQSVPAGVNGWILMSTSLNCFSILARSSQHYY